MPALSPFARLTLLGGLLGAALFSAANARTVQIVSADRLELRKLDGQELIVFSGSPVELRVGDDIITAKRVEYNKTRRTLTLVGEGSYRSVQRSASGAATPQLLRGQNLVVDLSTEDVLGEDVIVTTTDLEIRGEDVQRVPGQLTVNNNYFTPCAKCGRTPNDYAFRSNKVLLYPGDRLVAYGATLLLADAPVAYFPVVVLPLNDPDRQPRFEISRDAADGLVSRLDLPFIIGSSAQGFTSLRYFQNRSPSWGFGVDVQAYNLPFGVRKLDGNVLALPRPVGDPEAGQGGYDIDFSVDASGHFDLGGTRSGVDFTLNADRRDIGQALTSKGVAIVEFGAKTRVDPFNITLDYLDRFGPPVQGTLPNVLRRPEIELDPDPGTIGPISEDFKVTVGNYYAEGNPLAARTRTEGPNISDTRLVEQHSLGYEVKPWGSATLGATNTFTGQYYGSGRRVVNLTFGVKLTQAFSENTGATLTYDYLRQEGTSPFRFDPSYRRSIAGILGLSGASQVTPWLRVNLGQSYDFVQQRSAQTPFTFGLRLTPAPLDFAGNVYYDLFDDRLERFDVNLTLGQGVGLIANANTSYSREGGGYAPLDASLSYVSPDRGATAKLGASYNLQKGYLESLRATLDAVAGRDALLNPVTLSASETFGVRNPSLTGFESLTSSGTTFRIDHTFLLQDAAVESEDYTGKCVGAYTENCGNLTFSLQSPSGAANSWKLTYGGLYDLGRGGWTTPQLTAQADFGGPNRLLQAQASVNFPGLDSPYLELSSAALSAGVGLTPRIGLNGQVNYYRARSGAVTSDTLTFNPLSLTLALGRFEKPDAYVTAALQQSFTFRSDGQAPPQPLQPIFGVVIDRCCYTVSFELNPVLGRARLALSLPGGGQALDFTPVGPSLPGTPFGGTNP